MLLLHLSLLLHSCMNWIETQREKSFWMISSASCKKEVCNCVSVCLCLSPPQSLSDIRQSTVYLSFTHMGGVFIHFGNDCFMVAQPLIVPRL